MCRMRRVLSFFKKRKPAHSNGGGYLNLLLPYLGLAARLLRAAVGAWL